jgi:hypothetical protein
LNFSLRRAGVIAAFVVLALVVVSVLGQLGVFVPRARTVADTPDDSATPTAEIASQVPIELTITAVSTLSDQSAMATAIAESSLATPTPGQTANGSSSLPTSPSPSTIFLPVVVIGSQPENGTPTPTQTPVPYPAPASALQATATPTPTRGPIQLTKLGLGVYASGGGELSILDQARPSVILLLDPTIDFAQEVHKRFPGAFIVGRIFVASEPLDNPTQRGSDFADRVAGLAVPLKGVVNAWMSYNEIGSGSDLTGLANYDLFQAAFAHRLQDTYGVAAVAGNDGPRAIPAELYPHYYADAIRVSKYFGVHIYPDPSIKSLRDPNATDQVLYYRKIKAALDAAGIPSGQFIATEVGLYNGWRGVTSDDSMGNDFTWLADQMKADSYVLGMTIFGTFRSTDQWGNFEIAGSSIPQIIGDYNTVH